MAEKICIKYTLTGLPGITLKTVASPRIYLLLKECEEFIFVLNQGGDAFPNGWKMRGLWAVAQEPQVSAQPVPIFAH